MARPSGPKNRCSGNWTEARFKNFIVSLLRAGTRKWEPISATLKEARVSRGNYLCKGCNQVVPKSTKVDGKRKNNVTVDHIFPVVDPDVGFTSWEEYINRMFCEKENLQVLCYSCHQDKSNQERAVAANRRQRDKNV